MSSENENADYVEDLQEDEDGQDGENESSDDIDNLPQDEIDRIYQAQLLKEAAKEEEQGDAENQAFTKKEIDEMINEKEKAITNYDQK